MCLTVSFLHIKPGHICCEFFSKMFDQIYFSTSYLTSDRGHKIDIAIIISQYNWRC